MEVIRKVEIAGEKIKARVDRSLFVDSYIAENFLVVKCHRGARSEYLRPHHCT